ncbi:amino acid adenylation domain-containing protein [Paenibacillus sp.]|jgi:amino acid adenylation domain-containing protein|uniref:non-ribosomal peptide synthetase n=1 Tax=Paenibacillus sp. TaxID=58172 RepID=UPI00281D1FDF|nr:amino acid adenylation domain-containing protein [Paenibacillus sp.]MDR0268869.1 amino acid adenylation domain-containing protein [Paenibacillus sp.]
MLTKIEGYRLSPEQRRIWELGQDGQYEAFFTRVMLLLEGEVDKGLLKSALHEMAVRHEVLGATFNVSQGTMLPEQVIGNVHRVLWKESVGDWRMETSDGQKVYLDHLFANFSEYGFDLEKGPLFQVEIVTLALNKHALLIALPALFMDNAIQPFVNELIRAYEKLADNTTVGSEEEYVSYAVLSERYNELLETERSENGRNYWAAQDLTSALKIHLPFGNSRQEGASFSPRTLIWEMPTGVEAGIAKLATQQETEVSTVLLAAWQALLVLLIRGPVMVGVAYDGRSDKKLLEVIGPLARYVPLAGGFDRDDSFRSVLGLVKLAAKESQEWQGSFSWEAFQENSSTPYLPFGYDFSELQTWQTNGDLKFTVLRHMFCFDRFDLRLSGVKRADGKLAIEFHYDLNVLCKKDVVRLCGYFERLITQVIDEPESPIGHAKLVCEEEQEQEQLLLAWNQTNKQFSHHHALHRLFEIQVAKTPDHIAAVYGEQTLSYVELNNRANRLASILRTNGVVIGSIVAIACERSLDLIVGMLAVLKAGGAYLPIDIDYPMERIAYMLQDSQTELLVTQQNLAERFENQSVQMILLDDLEEAGPAKQKWDNLDLHVREEQPAYVIYTSGSTGRPKGIVIGHGAICNHMQWMQAEFPLEDSDRVMQKTASSFDASVWEFYAPLLAGAQLVFAKPGTHLDPAALVQEIQEHRVTTLQVVPTMLGMLLEQEAFANCTSLRRVFAGGEQLTLKLQERLFLTLPHVDLINLYGPTECCIDSTYWVAERGAIGHMVPIGRPIANMQVYVLDEYQQPVPQGVAGELYIGGAGLAIGYLHRPDLTAERFVVHPFTEGKRLYKTGDLVRTLPGGELEFLGRIDDQVKLRGLRIELGEIEAILQCHESVQQAIVLLREDNPGHQLLVAYIVCKREHPQIHELRLFLNEKLPEYMVPSFYVFLNAFPLMPNGKVDRRQLQQPDLNVQGHGTEYAAPSNSMEGLIAGIWSEVLDLSAVGIRNDFFELGGDSLAALKIVALSKREGILMTLEDIFKLRRIEEIAAAIEERTNVRDQKKDHSLPIGGSK